MTSDLRPLPWSFSSAQWQRDQNAVLCSFRRKLAPHQMDLANRPLAQTCDGGALHSRADLPARAGADLPDAADGQVRSKGPLLVALTPRLQRGIDPGLQDLQLRHLAPQAHPNHTRPAKAGKTTEAFGAQEQWSRISADRCQSRLHFVHVGS